MRKMKREENEVISLCFVFLFDHFHSTSDVNHQVKQHFHQHKDPDELEEMEAKTNITNRWQTGNTEENDRRK